MNECEPTGLARGEPAHLAWPIHPIPFSFFFLFFYFDPLSIIVLILSLYQQKQKSMQILEWGLKISYDEKYLRAEELKREIQADENEKYRHMKKKNTGT